MARGGQILDVEIDMENFNKMIKSLERDLGVPIEKVIKGEAEAVLNRAASLTKLSSAAKLRKRYTLKGGAKDWEPKKILGFTKKQYGPKQDPQLVRYFTWQGKKWDTRKIEREDLQKVKKHLAKLRDKKINAVGLSKASWKVMADQLGLKHKVTKTAEKALQRNPQYKAINHGIEHNDGGSYKIELLSNSNCLATKGAMGRSALRIAMEGRVKFYKMNMRKEVFESFETKAAKYGFIVDQ